MTIRKRLGKILPEELRFQAQGFKIRERIIQLRGGGTITRWINDKRGKRWVVAVPLTSNLEIVLTDEPKWGHMKRYTLLVAGRMQKGETPIDAAKRELKEETGYVSDNWQVMGKTVDESPDKTAGGECYLVLASCCARPVANPEIMNRAVLVKWNDTGLLIKDEHPEVEFNVPISIACLARAREYLADSPVLLNKSQPP